MKEYSSMSKEELNAEFSAVKKEYEAIKSMNLSLNMARGKPGSENLDLSNGLFGKLTEKSNFSSCDGVDCRNYGGMDGISDIKKLFSQILEMPEELIIAGGNSSLNMMFDTVCQGMVSGLGGEPWVLDKKRKFLCPAPGYDRHFAITEYFGFELISVPLNDDGPDMDMVEEYIKDSSVKGIWCVPKYSNPNGITYSDEVVKRFANLKPASKDFHIFWDNAYAVHDIYGEGDKLLNLYEECKKSGNEDLPIFFASTSKITLPGAGVAVMAASKKVLDIIKSRMKYQTIGPDKLNQLRHSEFLPDLNAVKEQMKKHAEIIRPKFEAVLDEFDNTLNGLGIAKWTKPNGGYFISLFVMNGCAKRVGELCKEAGLILTNVGATYPYGKDPFDSNIRIAPTYPSTSDVKKAANVLSVAVRYAALEKLV